MNTPHGSPLRGLAIYRTSLLGLTPQALCLRLLRRLQGSLFALRAQCGRDIRTPSRSWATLIDGFLVGYQDRQVDVRKPD